MVSVKAIAKNGLLLLGASLFAFLMGELLIRWLAPQQLVVMNPDIWRPDEQIGWRHNANVQTTVNSGGGSVHFVTDENGFRINHSDHQLPGIAPALEVVVIGDSFLEALALENRATIPSLLQEQMSSRFDRFIRFTNDSVGGWGPNQYLKETTIVLEQNDFDLGIVFIYTANDVAKERYYSFSPRQVAADHSFKWPEEWTHKAIVDAIAYPINDFFETRSHLFVFLKTRLRTALSRMGLTAYYFPDVFETNQRESPRWSVTSEICKDIQREFQKHDIDVIFVLLPASYQVHKEEFDAYVNMFDLDPATIDLDQPRVLLAEAFSRNSLTLLDPYNFLRERAEAGAVLYGAIDNHFNANGHAAVTDFLRPHVETAIAKALEGNDAATSVRK